MENIINSTYKYLLICFSFVLISISGVSKSHSLYRGSLLNDTIPNNDTIPKQNFQLIRKAPGVVLINTTAIVSVGIYKWDWGSDRFGFKDEGFFGANTSNGGADKTGHLYATYIISELNMHFLKRQNVDHYIEYGILLAWLNMLVVELGDGFSKTYGFSFGDMLFNTMGAGVSYLRAKNEFAKNFIDIRLEMTPSEFSFDAISETNYTAMKHILVLKPAAFTNSFFKYFEFHAGYYTRGYRGPRRYDYSHKIRTAYIGIGLNLHTILLDRFNKYKLGRFVGKVLHGYQIPKTYVPINVFYSKTKR